MIDVCNFTLSDVTAVLPDRVVDDATIVVRDGVIVDVLARSLGGADVVDGHRAICIPGIVDSHSDAFEKEIRPRPGVVLPHDFALRSFEGRAAAAGVTTVFHGVGFEENDRYDRTVEQAVSLCDAIDRRRGDPAPLIDHHVLHRLDVRDDAGLSALIARLDARGTPAVSGADLPLVSYEDHTPGQGQYRDRSRFEQYIAGTRAITDDEARRAVDEVIAERDARSSVRDVAIGELGVRARRREIRLMAHDSVDRDEIEVAYAAGMTIAEFPTTVEAAVVARELGMRTVSGAPNALRGKSHSGNVSARELVARGLCDGLASDYLPSTLIGAMAAMVEDRVCDLVTAVRLVTRGPALTVGLDDRGEIAPGRRADLALIDLAGALPTVRSTVCQAAGRAVAATVASGHGGPVALRT